MFGMNEEKVIFLLSAMGLHFHRFFIQSPDLYGIPDGRKIRKKSSFLSHIYILGEETSKKKEKITYLLSLY